MPLCISVGRFDLTGCGFIETVEVLVDLGADLNARDVTACTPLQNAAHGTYSALAAMPATQQPGVPLLASTIQHSACTCLTSYLPGQAALRLHHPVRRSQSATPRASASG